MWKVINVSADRTKIPMQRTATNFDPEPSIAGVRLRQGHLMLIEDVQYERLKNTLEAWKKNGMVEFGPATGDEAPRPGVSVLAKAEHKTIGEVQMDGVVPPAVDKQQGSGDHEHHNPTGPAAVSVPPPSDEPPPPETVGPVLPNDVPDAAATIRAEADAIVADPWADPLDPREAPKKGRKKSTDR